MKETEVCSMKVIGIDFTSRPSRRKPLTCLHGLLEDYVLKIDSDPLVKLSTFEEFEVALKTPGPWIAGIDCPFGQSRKFIENANWPHDWAGYVTYAGSLSREGFREELNRYRAERPFGDKEHRRVTDLAVLSISPQKLHGVPVGLMFYEGAQRLVRSGVTIPMLQAGDPERIVVEAYPGVLARFLIGRTSYKTDDKTKQTEKQREWRRVMLDRILGGEIEASYGLRIQASKHLEFLVDDPSGDQIDSLLCAIQAAWAYTMKDKNYGAPSSADSVLEGWIADPNEKRPEHLRERDMRSGSLFGAHRGSVYVREGVDLTEPVFDELTDAETGRELEH
jgi:hypothetical protein